MCMERAQSVQCTVCTAEDIFRFYWVLLKTPLGTTMVKGVLFSNLVLVKIRPPKKIKNFNSFSHGFAAS